MTPGRACPLHYRYPPSVFNRAADIHADTIYVIGGLYGNHAALSEIHALAAAETVSPTLVFNGDFNWFNIDAETFSSINTEVLQHTALRGNVETELANEFANDDAGCGCAYPDYVDDADVERSNEIMQTLRTTAQVFPALTEQLSQLPMHLVAQIGDARFGIVHGDAESLAGWRFAHDSLHEPENVAWLHNVCEHAKLTGFACSHTCLPTFRRFKTATGVHLAINNGAAGMPNFAGTAYGLITRLSVHPPRDGIAQYGDMINGVYIDAIPVHYDAQNFREHFLANWPQGSPAHHSYFQRISEGPDYAPPHALGFMRAPSVCA